MEELLILILQFIIEFLFELLSYWPWDVYLYRRDEDCPKWLLMVLTVMVGGGVGMISVWVFPHTVIPFGWARIANVALAPLASATLSKWRASIRRRTSPEIEPNFHWWATYCFTLGLVLIRFIYATR